MAEKFTNEGATVSTEGIKYCACGAIQGSKHHYCSVTHAALEARCRELEAALRAIADADRSYPDKRIADDMQYRARTALETGGGK